MSCYSKVGRGGKRARSVGVSVSQTARRLGIVHGSDINSGFCWTDHPDLHNRTSTNRYGPS